jgi:tRNA(adenine34) deaminase
MSLALAQAELAARAGEVPVGAVVVRRGEVIAQGYNSPRASHDPTAHAEINALRAAAQVLGNYRLDECEVFVTLEPCVMCAGALVQARVKRVVFGAREPKFGALGSVLQVSGASALHRLPYEEGVLAGPCAALLQQFFQHRRTQQLVQRAELGFAVRQDALRTPDTAFPPDPADGVHSAYMHDLPVLQGLRLHYLHAGQPQAMAQVWLHGAQHWSVLWRANLAQTAGQGGWALAPDLIGFGRSDKPKKTSLHTPSWHAEVLSQWLHRLQVEDFVLITGPGLEPLLALLKAHCGPRLRDLQLENDATMRPALARAPYPDAGHTAGPRALQSWRHTHLSS